MFDACSRLSKCIVQSLLFGVCFSCIALAEDPQVPTPKPYAAELKPNTAGTASKSIDAKELRGLLEPYGWRVEQDDQGGVLLYPRATGVSKSPSGAAPGPDVASSVPSGQGFTAGDVERLRGMLTPHGWRVEADGVGGVLLYPRSVETSAPVQKGSSKRSLPIVAPRAGFTSRDIAHLRSLLSPHGWRVEADGEGGVLLYPGALGAHSLPRTANSRRAQSRISSVREFDSGELEILRALLAPHGWRVEGDSQGGVLLIPHQPVAEEPAVTYVAAKRWSGVVLPAIQGGTIRVPIDSWEKAYQLTRSWIELSGQKDLFPGKIRKINKVYLVSVVSRVSPHPLRHQIVFRQDDGHMFLVY
jgi:hypothetical protein